MLTLLLACAGGDTGTTVSNPQLDYDVFEHVCGKAGEVLTVDPPTTPPLLVQGWRIVLEDGLWVAGSPMEVSFPRGEAAMLTCSGADELLRVTYALPG